jgi:hypothetical protein
MFLPGQFQDELNSFLSLLSENRFLSLVFFSFSPDRIRPTIVQTVMCVPPTPLLSWDSFCVSPSQPKKRGGKINAEDQKCPALFSRTHKMRLLSTFQHCPFVKKIEMKPKLGGKTIFSRLLLNIFWGG